MDLLNDRPLDKDFINSRTYTKNFFYRCRENFTLEELPIETLHIFQTISEDTRNYQIIRKKKPRKNKFDTTKNDNWRSNKPNIFQSNDNSLFDTLSKKITKLLNKLSHPNIDMVTNNTLDVFKEITDEIDFNQFINMFIEKLFQKAIIEPLFYKDYVFLLDNIILYFKNNDKSIEQTIVSNNIQEITQQLLHNFFEDFNTNPDNFKGLCFLISELYLHQHIKLSIITECLDQLNVFLNNDINTINVEKVIQHYCYICIPLLNSENFPIERYLEIIEEWKTATSIPMKSKFMIMDLFDKFESDKKNIC